MNGPQKMFCNRRFAFCVLYDNDSWAKMLEDAQGECNAIREAHSGCEGIIGALRWHRQIYLLVMTLVARKQNQELQDQVQSLIKENLTKQRLCAPMQRETRNTQGQDAGVGLLLMKESAAQQEVAVFTSFPFFACSFVPLGCEGSQNYAWWRCSARCSHPGGS